MVKEKSTYSSYKEGLEIGDIVYYDIKNVIFSHKSPGYSALVLDREFLYEKETRYGIRRFFKYKFLDINSNFKNKIFDIETKHMKVCKTIKSKKEK